MAYLTAAVVLVGLVAGLDLLLTVGVIRRLRQHTEHLSQLLSGGSEPGSLSPLPPGSRIGQFTTSTAEGESLSRDALAGRTLVGFFSPGCQACAPMLPAFTELAATVGRDRTLAVVAALGEEPSQAYLSRLDGAARLVVESRPGELHDALQVAAYPMFYLLDQDGTVLAGGYDVRDVAGAAAGQVVVEGRAV